MDNDKKKDIGKKSKPTTDIPSTSSNTKKNINEPFSTSEMTPKEAYFELLRTWVNQANMSQSAMACFPYYLMMNYPQLFSHSHQQQRQNNSGVNVQQQNNAGFSGFTFGTNGVNGNNAGDGGGAGDVNDRRFGDFLDNELRHAQEEIINQHGGYEFVIAPFWRRLVAEIIDSTILLLLKLLLTFTVVDIFNLNLNIALNLDNLKKYIEDDYSEFLSLSSDLLLIEIFTKILVCFYEALWTASGHIYIGGATPGKIIMGIRIVYAEAVLPLPPNFNFINNDNNNNNNGKLKALVFPGSNPGFKRALLRAMAKNILMALLFPMCFIMLFFKNNRTAYDVMTKTIVVEENAAPLLRRRN